MEQGVEAAKQMLGPDVVILDMFESNDQIEVVASIESEECWESTQDLSGEATDPQDETQNLQEALAEELRCLSDYRQKLDQAGAALLPEELTSELFVLRRSLRRASQSIPLSHARLFTKNTLKGHLKYSGKHRANLTTARGKRSISPANSPVMDGSVQRQTQFIRTMRRKTDARSIN